MALNSLVWLAGAVWAGIVGGPGNDAVSQEFPTRASVTEIADSCRTAGGLAWGTDAPESNGRYGCITTNGWVACDHYGNCTGGSGKAVHANRSERPTSASSRESQ